MYAPQGRFVSRDPIGYRGGLNLMNYVVSSPINQTDSSGQYHGLDGGLIECEHQHAVINPTNRTDSKGYCGCNYSPSRSDAQCCADALAQYNKQGVNPEAGFILCDGREVICVYTQNLGNSYPELTDPNAKNVFARCLREHERSHLLDPHLQWMQCDGGISLGAFPLGEEMEGSECTAYKSELICLDRQMDLDPKCDAKCRAQIAALMKKEKDGPLTQHCKAANRSPDIED